MQSHVSFKIMVQDILIDLQKFVTNQQRGVTPQQHHYMATQTIALDNLALCNVIRTHSKFCLFFLYYRADNGDVERGSRKGNQRFIRWQRQQKANKGLCSLCSPDEPLKSCVPPNFSWLDNFEEIHSGLENLDDL